MKLLSIGSTGLVGSYVLQLALADHRVSAIVAPTRRELPTHAKLLAPLVDFDALPPQAEWWQADAVICTLGTTMRQAGSEAAFRRVDYDYPLAVARLARQHGTPVYVLNSAIGADTASRFFYNQVKGELEKALADEGFTSLTYVRPGVIGGSRQEFRAGELVSRFVLGLAGPLLPRRWRLNPAERIAQALVEAALEPKPGIHLITSEQLC